MHYELYVDSLFFLNFIMNLYLLILVNRSTFRTATPGRIASGGRRLSAAISWRKPWHGGGRRRNNCRSGRHALCGFSCKEPENVSEAPGEAAPLLLRTWGNAALSGEESPRGQEGAHQRARPSGGGPGVLAVLQRQTAGRSLRRPVQGHPCEGGGADESERPGGLGKQSGGTHQRETCLRGGEKGI